MLVPSFAHVEMWTAQLTLRYMSSLVSRQTVVADDLKTSRCESNLETHDVAEADLLLAKGVDIDGHVSPCSVPSSSSYQSSEQPQIMLVTVLSARTMTSLRTSFR
jgi:hypothetical protein